VEWSEAMKPWKPRAHKKLGGGATLLQEREHLLHRSVNLLTILRLKGEAQNVVRKERGARDCAARGKR